MATTQRHESQADHSLAPRYVVSDVVYRKWRYPAKDDYWYEVYFVEKITARNVWVRGFMEPSQIMVKRSSFERLGFSVSIRHGAVFYTAMPDEYRRQTIGYLLDKEPREILGLDEKFSDRELKSAYRRLAAATHPDRGGNSDEFRKVQAAYERLSGDMPRSISDVLRQAKEAAKKHVADAERAAQQETQK